MQLNRNSSHRTQPIRILLVDDYIPMREQVETLLSHEQDMKVVAMAGSAEEALQIDQTVHPDVVVMDVMLPGMNGIEATRRIMSERPDAKVLVLSNHSGASLVRAVHDAGGLGYVCKSCANEELIPALRSVGAGIRYEVGGTP